MVPNKIDSFGSIFYMYSVRWVMHLGKKNDVLLGRSHISRPKTCTFESMILRVSPVWSDRIDTVDGKNPAPLRMPHMLFFPPPSIKNVFGHHPKWCRIFSINRMLVPWIVHYHFAINDFEIQNPLLTTIISEEHFPFHPPCSGSITKTLRDDRPWNLREYS